MKPALIEPLESRYAPAALVSISGPTQVAEGASGNDQTLTFIITLSEPVGTDVVVDCSAMDGTAALGSDYDFTSGPRTIPANTLSTDVTVTVRGDGSYEVDEVFSLKLSNISSGDAVLDANDTATVTIQNDDSVPTVSISDADQQEGNSGTTNFSFIISLSEVAGVDVTVHLTSTNGTAGAEDFTLVDQDFTIEAGLASKTFTVAVNGDTTSEGDEDFTLTLTNPTNATISDGQGTGTIRDDDNAVFSVADISVTEGTNSTAIFIVRLSSPQSGTVTINYTTADDTATAGSDYTALSGTLTFDAGIVEKQVEVQLTNDAAFEPTESFFLRLSNASTGTIQDSEATATITDDDTLPTLSINGPGGQSATVRIDEGNSTSPQIFTLSLDHSSSSPITIHLKTANGSALAGEDFVAIDQDITFAAGETVKTVTLTVNGDGLDESDETFTLTATSVSGAVTLPGAPTSVVLRNDDRLITVSDAAPVTEGNSGTTQMAFTVTLSAPSTHAVTLNYTTANGTATAGTDYTGVLSPQLLTFAPGETSKTIFIDVLGDTVGEADENLTLNFSSVTDALINKTSVRGTINDDDTYLSIDNAQVVEGAANTTTEMVFTVHLLRYTGSTPVTVNYQTASSVTTPATAGQDYVAISPAGTLTFQPGETTKTISVTVRGDAEVSEKDETFLVKLSNASNGSPDTEATGTILDDEGLITVSNASIVEGDSGTANMVFVVSLVGLPTHSGNISVRYATEDVTALSSGAFADYTAATGTVVFAANVVQQTISVPIRGDLLREGDQTFNLKLSNVGIPTTEQASIGTPTVVGTITDNDPLPSFSISGGSVVEGATGAQIVFTVNLSGGSESAVSVDFATANGTATAGQDYTAQATTTLNFAPGQTSTTIAVPVLDDATIEGDEAFTAKLSNAQGATIGTSTATGTIKDDDIVVTLAPTDFATAVTEGNSGVVKKSMTVTLSAAPASGKSVEVTFLVTPTGATAGSDFVLLNSSNKLTFSAGQTSKTIDFNIVGDAFDEANETFSVALVGATNAVLGPASSAVATIADDDATPTITIDDAQVTEGNSGTAPMNFTVRLSAPSGQPVTVLATPAADGTASSGDFSTTAQTITFEPGETVKTLAVNITGDTTDEADETFHIGLSNATNATIADATALGTIVDNDAPSLSISDESIVEGDSGTTVRTFTVTLSKANSRVVTVDWLTADGTAQAGSDYVAVAPTTLVFNPGEALTKTVSVTINGDSDAETDEVFFVQLQPHTGTPVNAVIADGQGAGTIQNDEMQFVVDTVTAVSGVEEGATANTGNKLTFTIKRTGDTTRAGSVTYATEEGAAKSSGARPDFVAASGTLLFAAGETSKTVDVTLVNDLNHEADETFKLKLTSAVGGVVGATAEQTATITGSDALPTVEILDSSISEGAANATTSMTFTVRLRAGGSTVVDEVEAITVNYETQAGTARDAVSGSFLEDFTKVIGGTLTFAPGESTKTITISVKGDGIDENNETFTVKLTGATAATSPNPTTLTLVDDGAATGTIIDDDDAPLVTFANGTNGDLTFTEGSLGTFTIKPKLQLVVATNGGTTYSEKDITLTLTAVPGTATAGVDFIATSGSPQTVTISAGTSAVELDYAIVGDSIREADETFTLVISDPQNVRVGDGGAKITITNDDPVPQLVMGGVSVVEGDSGTSSMVFTVALQGATDQTVTVNFASSDGTAVSKGALPDFTAVSGSLTFAPGETAKTISVPIFGDTWAEANESFTVTLSGATNATILTATGTGTIQNGNDTAVGLIVQDAVSVENPVDTNGTAVANPKITFKVELTKTLDTAVTFSAQTRNGTAIGTGTADSDFVALAQGFTINAGQSSVNVDVTLKPDTVFESTESFFLGIGGLSSNVVEARGEGRGTILNDDLVFVDTRSLRYVDEDGDLATIKITKGVLSAATLTFGPVNQSTGGRTLQLIDFTTNPALFDGTELRITVEPQTGFATSGRATDGRVDVGYIRGAIPDTNTLQFTRGIDFTNIVVPGDVGKITAGNQLITPSITGKISVQSLGVRGTTTGAPDNVSAFLSIVNAITVEGDLQGIVQVIGNEFGSINSLKIGGALRGDTTSAAKQSGIVFFTGTLGKATIGDIIGGAAADSGVVNGNTAYTAKIGTLHVLGDVIGGKGTRSGRIVAKTIGSVVIDGDVIGGGDTGTDTDGTTPKGSDSGEILATASMKSLKIAGDVKGGIQRNTGVVSSGGALETLRIGGSLIGGTGAVDSGVVIVNRVLSNLTIAGDVLGASGERSGTVQVGGTITKFTIGTNGGTTGGNVKGGSGEDSGTISAGAGINQSTGDFVVSGGSIGTGLIYGDIVGGNGDGSTTRTGTGSGGVQVGGQLTKLDVRGDLIGGDSPAAGTDTSAQSMTQSGFVLAGRLGQMILGGDLRAGRNLGTGLADSGSIRVHENITSLTILGNVVGNDTANAVISAGNNGPLVNGVMSPAIATLTIGKKAADGTVSGGNVSFLEVLAGYSEFGTADEPRGTARNADAQIGTVTIRGNMQATNIVAGSDAGTDGLFGTVDDVPLSGTGTSVINKSGVFSAIAKVIVGGNILASDDVHGIVAQVISSIKAANLNDGFTLSPKGGNDFTELTDGTNMWVNEVSVA